MTDFRHVSIVKTSQETNESVSRKIDQIDQQIQRWYKDQLQDSIANKGMAWPNYRQASFPS